MDHIASEITSPVPNAGESLEGNQFIKTCAHRLFEAQVERTPDAVALTFADQCMTYLELNCRANQLAHHLQKLGIGPEMRVALCLERSFEMIVALLGVLKARAAFVPLDPAYPEERLAFMLHDAQVALLITQQSLLERFPDPALHTLCLDTDRNMLEQYHTQNANGTAHPENLAYIIYTSGSTGRPKGVMVRQQGVVNLFHAQQQAFGMQTASRVLQFASLSFDASVWEICMALLSGATLHLAPKTSLLPGPSLIEELQRESITIATLPPSTLAILPDVALPHLHVLITAGEACPANLVARWAPGRHFFNAYGPTETTVCATLARCNADETGNPPLGLPLAHMQVHILDGNHRPVPAGASGEICIGGIGLARGYFKRPDLTAERFIPDPFAQEPGARLYKTGDLARALPDGNIEFLGRSDSQVKLRGFRVELGEIEIVLNAHQAVREAVVIVREDEPGEQRLVAYLLADQQQDSSLQRLPDDLSAALPDYMVPGAFVILNEWPLTPNGKIDRRALPAPDASTLAFLAPFTAPRTPCEEMLTQIWRETLHLDRIGIHDNFFHLGGHSLLATQIAARIRSTFQVELPLALLFTSATIAQLASSIEQRQTGDPLHAPAIQPVPRTDDLPLSFSQERVWFLQQLDPTNMAYNAQAMLRLTGHLDVHALEHSLSEIIRRHEIFRTTFPAVNGRPIQRIHPAQPVKLPLIDLQGTPEEERGILASQLMDQIFQKPFDVTQLPLARWTLLRLSDQEHILVHVEHHLVHDGWSFTVFLHEFQALYTAFVSGEPSPLPELSLQFADFAQWQRQWMKGQEAEAQLHYWKQKLAGSPTLLTLPTDYPRPAVLGFKGAVQRVEIPVELCEALRARCRQEGITLFMLLLGAFLTLLYRYAGQEDICVGTGIANRRWRESEPLIGMVINTLALRTDLSGAPTFRELLDRIRAVTLEAYAHQDLPFGTVVEALQPERSLSHSPLYQTLFSFHDSPLPDLTLPDLHVHITEGLSNHSAKFDLNIVVIPRAEQQVGIQSANAEKEITFIWEYNTDLFLDTTIQRMIAHYQIVLERISADPTQRLTEIPLLTGAERQQLLFEWNATATDYPRARCIHELFETQVEQTPHALAATCGGDRLTYRELNRRANQLAHYLRQRGVGPEILVGICVERSLDMLVGLLGILKAGGAYLPLDPYYPRERLAFMVEEAKIPLFLTQQHLLPHLPGDQALAVCLDTDWERIQVESEENLAMGVVEHNLAYVIYTSGSTGKPKGIQIPHQAALNLLFSMRQKPGLHNKDVLLSVTSLSFDIAALELFLPLITGASVVIASRAEATDGSRLVALLASTSITAMQATPATWSLLLAAGWQGTPLLKVLCGGEALQRDLAAQLLERAGSLWNLYGPTETTIWSTVHAVTASDTAGLIGHPIANTQVYLLDASWQPVPIGVPGALYIGGDGLARGYLKRPELTAERFVPHPYSRKPGARLYKTGDLARYRPDGTLEFLGRLDYQVKVRGFRIELGEIETILSQHPTVHSCIVLLHGDLSRDQRLVAYVSSRSEQSPQPHALRTFLQERLPEYMIPSHFVLLERFPLTPNGKVDRQALPQPDWDRSLTEEAFVAPRNAIEEEIAQIWREQLRSAHIGIYDNFFTLGGHSLLATQLVSRLNTAFHVDLSLRSFFESPTIAGLAVAILQHQANKMDSELLAQLLAEVDQTA